MYIDIAFCIDATSGMQPVIYNVKEGALTLFEDLQAKLFAKDKYIDQLRVKIVVYRDFYCDKEKAIKVSEFFALPAEREQFSKFINDINAEGGGDEPENGLEAVDVAIKSDWDKTPGLRRHVIIVLTDASAHPLEKNEGSKPQNYPSGMAKNFEELTDNWDKYLSHNYKRLVLFAPDAYPWTNMSNNWENVVHIDSQAGEGLDDLNYQEILDIVALSV